jgi:hypothetical protein
VAKDMNEKSYGACCRAPSPASWSAFQTRGPVRGSKSFSIEVYVRAHAGIRLGRAGTGQARIIHSVLPCGFLAAQVGWAVQLVRSCRPSNAWWDDKRNDVLDLQP